MVAAWSLLTALWNGKPAADNYYDGLSLEWQTQSPPIEHNFHDTPHVHGSPYDFAEIDKSIKGFH